ncbi:TMEM175 family protein [Streptomyces fuscigenes]|uniref:TMEM175 family protein n=1 Tax=Streptomyces fuscigenes TaxID=1528880 RepID=UPI001F2A72DC|nr:TMEM175 family protein [Streptomyces fuscigenes]MCF3961085.1 DUF1211 domain-containing protein [Streptomyces fuscigenes]
MGASDGVGNTGATGPDTGGLPGQASPPDGGERGGASGERLVLFTDAVTAISITLLILPLVDLVPEVSSAHEPASEVVTGHVNQIWSFLLSFLVIANIWGEHHRTFSSIAKVTRPLTVWNMGWLLSVVVLPLPTEMIGAFGRDRFVMAFYYATLLASMVCRSAMLRILKSSPSLVEEGDAPETRQKIQDAHTDSRLNVVALVVAFAIALAVPQLQYYSLFLLLVPGRVLSRSRRTAR